MKSKNNVTKRSGASQCGGLGCRSSPRVPEPGRDPFPGASQPRTAQQQKQGFESGQAQQAKIERDFRTEPAAVDHATVAVAEVRMTPFHFSQK
jgi:hypothetical protein